MPQLRLRYSILLSVAAFALVIGGLGMISLKPGSVPAQAHDVEFVEEAARSNANCFWMEDDYGNGTWICVPKIDGLTGHLTSEQLDTRADALADFQAFSNEPSAGGGRPSM